eukprot:COSAG01_NODE_12415_length_1744_cov_0.965957_2_plen_56_part_00
MRKFLASPTTYFEVDIPWSSSTPSAAQVGKMPPMSLKSLPALGYLEQSVADAVGA